MFIGENDTKTSREGVDSLVVRIEEVAEMKRLLGTSLAGIRDTHPGAAKSRGSVPILYSGVQVRFDRLR